jgi:hypothetical protein
MEEIEDLIQNKASQREWGKKVEELDKIRIETRPVGNSKWERFLGSLK